MSVKQDRQGARTPTDLERKYNFDTRFADIMGAATDARTAAEKAQNAAEEAQNNSNNPAANLTHEEVFNLLTKNGAVQGIYRGDDGDIYINASYLKSGVIDASLIKTGILQSADGAIQIDLSEGATEPVFNTGISTNGILIRGDVAGAEEVFSAKAKATEQAAEPFFDMQVKSATDKKVIARLVETFNDTYTDNGGIAFVLKTADQYNEIRLDVNKNAASVRFYRNGTEIGNLRLGSLADGSPAIALDGVSQINGKAVSWKQNEDGTFTLIGT